VEGGSSSQVLACLDRPVPSQKLRQVVPLRGRLEGDEVVSVIEERLGPPAENRFWVAKPVAKCVKNPLVGMVKLRYLALKEQRFI